MAVIKIHTPTKTIVYESRELKTELYLPFIDYQYHTPSISGVINKDVGMADDKGIDSDELKKLASEHYRGDMVAAALELTCPDVLDITINGELIYQKRDEEYEALVDLAQQLDIDAENERKINGDSVLEEQLQLLEH